MYNWRKMTQEQRVYVLKNRRLSNLPWHSPPHRDNERTMFLITAACYEHKPIIGQSEERMIEFENALKSALDDLADAVLAWCLLPNHYHVLLKVNGLKQFTAELGKFHGRTSFQWNGEEACRGRKCFYRCNDRAIRSDRHKWATINYIHHNPVRHGYVTRWQDWPFSSATEYLAKVGHKRATENWQAFPLGDYGKGWDEPEL